MALTLPNQDVAHYLHASLERFNQNAVREISKRFHAAAAGVSTAPGTLSLAFDDADHVFTLTCQNCLGTQLDALLGNTIRDYVASDDENVERFAEVSYGDPFDEYDPEIEHVDTLPPPPAPKKSRAIHVLNFHGINKYGKAKAFRMRDLPAAIQFRALTRQNNSAVAKAVSFRRIRWDESNERHVFDGHVGQQLPKLSEDEQKGLEDLFDLVAFDTFERTVDISEYLDQEPAVRHWEFQGEAPTIDQWLEGMGRTKQVEPGEEPEITKDAIKFTGDPSSHQPKIGRLRMPKGEPLKALQAEEVEEHPEESEEQRNAAFAALMKSGDDCGSESEQSEAEEDKQSKNPGELPSTLTELKNLRIAQNETPRVSKAAEKEPKNLDVLRATPTRPGPGAIASENNSPAIPSMTHGASQTEKSFPEFDKRYAKVDGWGLTGDAANQAKWENENATPLSSQRKKARGVRTYESIRAERAQSTLGAPSACQSDVYERPVSGVTPMSYSETPLGGNEPWANNVVGPCPTGRMGILIDTNDSGMDAGRARTPLFPPGLFPPLGTPTPQSSQSAVMSTDSSAMSARPAKAPKYPPGLPIPLRPSGPTAHQSEELFMMSGALSGVSHPSQNQEQVSSTNPISQTPSKSSQTSRKDQPLIQFDDGHDAPLDERLQSQVEEKPRLYKTMGQQAGSSKNKAKKKPKSNAGKATVGRSTKLELPEPPPAPKVPKEKVSLSGPTNRKKVPKYSQRGEQSDVSEHKHGIRDRINQYLSSVCPSEHNCKVTVQFGLVLLTEAGDLTTEKALRSEELQESLDKHSLKRPETRFLPALGRHRREGDYLLRLPRALSNNDSPHDPRTKLVDVWSDVGEHGMNTIVSYDIEIVDLEGNEWKINFPQDAPDDIEMRPSIQNPRTIFIHYPLHVWDARIQPQLPATTIEPNETLQENIRTFIRTFQTLPESRPTSLPAFEAFVPDSAFRVTSLRANRVFTQTVSRGRGSWTVTQVWDLHVHVRKDKGLVAFAKEEKAMLREGRLWWEAGLRVEKLEGLEEIVSEVVEGLDSVGLVGLPLSSSTTTAVAKQRAGKVEVLEEYVPFW